jgi:hypothetical protein
MSGTTELPDIAGSLMPAPLPPGVDGVVVRRCRWCGRAIEPHEALGWVHTTAPFVVCRRPNPLRFPTRQKGRSTMTTVAPTNPAAPDTEPEATPLMEVCIDLAPSVQVRMDRCAGDVPLLEIITGQARLILSVDAGQADAVGPEHVAVAEAFASSAVALRDELRELVAAR